MINFKINIEDDLLGFIISKNGRDFEWNELDTIEQTKIVSAICSALKFFSDLL